MGFSLPSLCVCPPDGSSTSVGALPGRCDAEISSVRRLSTRDDYTIDPLETSCHVAGPWHQGVVDVASVVVHGALLQYLVFVWCWIVGTREDRTRSDKGRTSSDKVGQSRTKSDKVGQGSGKLAIRSDKLAIRHERYDLSPKTCDSLFFKYNFFGLLDGILINRISQIL